MKYKYIESLLSEIEELESRVANLKKNQNVSFSFFKESFKRTQEITRLLHELEFVQIEDMKGQMEKLVQFLSESEISKEEARSTPIIVAAEEDKVKGNSQKEEQLTTNTNVVTPIINIEEEIEEKSSPSPLHDTPSKPLLEPTQPLHNVLGNHKETILDSFNPKSKSLNDAQPVIHTIQDTKRSISLNDRFLFQRELFHNNRDAMNEMLTKLQSFSSFDVIEGYLKENTHWNFRDETVDKFMQMLKDSFK